MFKKLNEVIAFMDKEQLKRLEALEAITAKSKATEKDVEELSRKVKAGVLKRHEER